MKFYGRHAVSSKYPYYLHRLLLYTMFLSLKFSLPMFNDMAQTKSPIKNLTILHVCGTFFVSGRDPQKLI